MKNLTCCLLFILASITNLLSQFDWQHTDGPFGSFVSFLYTNDEYAFIPEGDFLFRSGDGIQWEKLEHPSFYRLAIYGDTIIHTISDPSQQTILLNISTDNGESWMEKELPSTISSVNHTALNHQGIFLVHPFHSYYSLFRSVDFGASWDTLHTPIPFGGFDLTVFDDRLYLYTLKRLYRLDSGGEVWEELILPNFTLPQQYMDDFVVRDSHIMITTEDYLFHSHDYGATWEQLNFVSSNSFDKIVMTDSFIYADIYGTILRTADYGFHWDTLLLEEDHPSFITLGGFKEIFLASTYNKGVYKWDETGGRMVESNEGLSKGAVYDLSSGGDFIWAACGNGVFKYDTHMKTWSDAMNLPQQSFQYEFVSSNDAGWVVAAGSYTDSFYFSEDFGETWKTIHTDYYITDLQLIGEHIFLFEDFGLLRSIDKGQQFEWVQQNIYKNDFVSFQGNYYMPGYDDSLYVTTDKGLTWDAIADPVGIVRLHAAGDRLIGLAVDTASNLALFISEYGIHWSSANAGFPDIVYFDVLDDYHKTFFFRDADYYYAFLGLDTAFFSPVHSIQWSPFETESYISNLILHNHVLYRGDEGVYYAEIANPFITAIPDHETNSTGMFTLAPNPVKEFVQIHCKSNQTTKGNLMLYSSNGMIIRSFPITVQDGMIKIKTDPLVPGIYFVKIDLSDHVEVLKFIKE